MKFWQIVESKPWDRDNGFDAIETIINDEIEIDRPEDADPRNWYFDYCNGQMPENKHDNELITCKLYSKDPSVYGHEDPEYSFEIWESEVFSNPADREYKFVVIDIKSNNGTGIDIFTEIYDTEYEAVKEAQREWRNMAPIDRDKRTDFFVGKTVVDEDGDVDIDNAEIIWDVMQ